MRSKRAWFGLAALLAVTSLAAAGNDVQLLDAVKSGNAQAVRALLQKKANVNASDPDGTTALHWAALGNDVETVDLLIGAGANAKAANIFGITALTVACTNANADIVERLLKAGADPNAAVGEGETPLMTAARTGNPEAVQLLVAHGAQVNARTKAGQTALMWAAAEGHTAVVTRLLRAGADLRARSGVDTPPARVPASPASPATSNTPPSRPVVDVTASPPIRLPRTAGFTPLLFAVREDRIAMVSTLLDAGADLNDTLPDGTSALVLAATNGHFELARLLLDRGTDPNADKQGWTALHALTWVRRPNFGFNPPGPVTTGNLDSLGLVRALVAHGANVNARMTKEPTNGYRNALNRIGATPLLMAARLADAPLMRLLLELGADPKLLNEDNTTLLMVASGVGIHSPGEDPGTEEEALECVKIALELGGDVNALDLNDETALHGAAYRGANSIVQLLVDHGAHTFDTKNAYGWTPLKIAEGVFRTATFKEAPQTAALLRTLMAKQSAASTQPPR
jgi:uncharacterized protein